MKPHDITDRFVKDWLRNTGQPNSEKDCQAALADPTLRGRIFNAHRQKLFREKRDAELRQLRAQVHGAANPSEAK